MAKKKVKEIYKVKVNGRYKIVKVVRPYEECDRLASLGELESWSQRKNEIMYKYFNTGDTEYLGEEKYASKTLLEEINIVLTI